MDLPRAPVRHIVRARHPPLASADPARADHDIELWSPDAAGMTHELRDHIAVCLSAAFSSRQWARTPMPIGDASDPHSAHGIIAQLGRTASIVLASQSERCDRAAPRQILGCVIGGILDPDLIETYGLGTFGASPGDGLLAYIGVSPSHQGARLLACGASCFTRLPAAAPDMPGRRGQSLARALFSSWLMLPGVPHGARVFVRTRRSIKSVMHLLEAHGFVFCGQLQVEFRGQRQERLVYARRGRQHSDPNAGPAEGGWLR